MVKNNLYDKLLYYLTAPKCVCCRRRLGINELPLCDSCIIEYKNIKLSDCSLCAKPMNDCLCVNDYLDRHFVHKLVKVFRYRTPSGPNDRIPSNELLYNIKRTKRRDLLKFIVDELEASLIHLPNLKNYIIISVPRSKGRIQKYGFDHSALIAKTLARRVGIEYITALRSLSKVAQKKTIGSERIKNAEFDYIKHAPNLSGKRILLFDDIVTTGASMGNCAALIKGLGAKQIVGVCVSVAYRDRYIPFAPSKNM